MDTYKIAVSKYALEKKIPSGSDFWEKFNGSFQNVELEPQQLLQTVYDGRPITTQHKNNWRISQNYLCGQHIGLDFDSGEKAKLSELIKDKFIERYCSFAHTTISHTEDNPRARVIFLLDTPIMQSSNYCLAVSALLWLFGTADRACRDSVRFWYGSPGCQFEYFDQVLPLDIVKHLIAQYQDTGQKEKKRSEYHAPAEMREVEDALKRIPAWGIDYDEWVNVLMAIHSQFGDAGYGLAESWGEGKKDEVSRKWKSFKAEGNCSGAVTIATVFGIAKRFGWKKHNG